MSGETFPTGLWFKGYSKNSRVLTVLWDTLYVRDVQNIVKTPTQPQLNLT